MSIYRPPLMRASEITPEADFLNRRQFMQAAALGLSALPFAAEAATNRYSTQEAANSEHEITHYNNYYEFGTDKADPAEYAHQLQTRPWAVEVVGEVGKPLKLDLDDLLKLAPQEERIYRLRCVEGWSMVIPWLGFALSHLLKRAEPNSRAKFVEFVSLHRPKQMPGQQRTVLVWPYTEGLRIDEAMHPLTLLVSGLYGKPLPKQNGAPLRLAVPWKYGFKSTKAIVTIRLRETMPLTSWMRAGPSEYGFYSNVNPEVDHPRWSQAKERRIGEFFKRPTLMFNGYGEEVAALYKGLDLRRNF